jgi:type I restriction enzyme S subunit
MKNIPLKNIADTASGGTPSRKNSGYFEGKNFWFKSGELNDSYIYSSEERITKSAIDDSSAKIFPAGTALIAMYGATAGKTAILGVNAATNQAICGIIPKKKNLYNKYIQYFFIYKRSSLLSQRIGGAQPNLNQEIIKNIQVPYCHISEQKRIVAKIEELFSQMDAGLAALERARANLARYRQSLLHTAFSGELTSAWREEHKDELEPAGELLKRIRAKRRTRWAADLRAKGKDPSRAKYPEPELPDTTNLPDLPQGWEWLRLDSISFINKKDQHIKKLPLETPVSFLPMAFIDQDEGKITKTETRILSQVLKGYTYFYEGDVLFAKITPCMENGKSAIAKGLINRIGFGSTEFHVIRPIIVNAKWVFYFLRQVRVRNSAKMKFTGTAGQLRVPAKFMRDLHLPIPPMKEADEIISSIESNFSVLSQLNNEINNQIERSTKLKNSILKKAFSGQLSSQYFNDGPVEEPRKIG